jgi:hypothetical protein
MNKEIELKKKKKTDTERKKNRKMKQLRLRNYLIRYLKIYKVAREYMYAMHYTLAHVKSNGFDLFFPLQKNGYGECIGTEFLPIEI